MKTTLSKRGRPPQERCQNNHPLTGDNRRTKLYTGADGQTRRVSAGCRDCNSAREKERRCGLPLLTAEVLR